MAIVYCWDFVPEQRRHEAMPCRYIPLDESGETLETLYSTATNEEIQKTLREWLLKTIAGLEGDGEEFFLDILFNRMSEIATW